MSNPKRTAEDRADRLFELLEDELLSASSEGLDEIAREWGVDPTVAAIEVDDAIEHSLKHITNTKLEEARKLREQELAKLGKVAPSPCSRDELLAAVSACMKEFKQGQATLQHRDLSELSESALRTMLQQLQALKE